MYNYSKEFIVELWEVIYRKQKLYGGDTWPGPQSNSSRWDLCQDENLGNGMTGK